MNDYGYKTFWYNLKAELKGSIMGYQFEIDNGIEVHEAIQRKEMAEQTLSKMDQIERGEM